MTSVDVSYDISPLKNIEKFFIAMIENLIPQVATVNGLLRVRDRVPAELPDLIANRGVFIAVAVLGGPSNASASYPVVDFDVYTSTQALSSSISAEIERIMLGVPIIIRVTGLGVLKVDRATVTLGPSEVEWAPDRTVRRYYSSYKVEIRRY